MSERVSLLPEHGWADLLNEPSLRCAAEGCAQPPIHDDEPRTTCPGCGGATLECTYAGGERAGWQIEQQQGAGIVRWRALLPVRTRAAWERVTLGEGDSPLLRVARLAEREGVADLLVKDEGGQPTLSFKSRGFSVLVARALEHGVEELVAPSAGNAAVALSAYGARAGIAVSVFVPEDLPASFVEPARAYGANVVTTGAHMAESGRAAKEHVEAARRAGKRVHPVGTLREPYRVEGKKTMGLEIWAQTRGDLPDAILYPTGGGTGLIGIEKALAELRAAGLIAGDARLPRLYAVQLEDCGPLVAAMEGRSTDVGLPGPSPALGLRVAAPACIPRLVGALRRSGGAAIAVSDAELRAAQRDLLGEGIDASPEGAATLAGMRRLRKLGAIGADDRVLLLNTAGNGRYEGL